MLKGVRLRLWLLPWLGQPRWRCPAQLTHGAVGAGAVGAGAALASGWLPAPWSERRSLVPTTLTAMAILIMAVMAMATAIRHTRTVTVIPTRTIIDTAMRPVTTPMRDPIAALASARRFPAARASVNATSFGYDFARTAELLGEVL